MHVASFFSSAGWAFHIGLGLHCVSKNDTGVAQYNFDAHQPILVIVGRDVAETVCYQWWFDIPPVLTNVSATWTPEIVSFQSCCILCVENDTAFGTCCRLRLLGRKSVHFSIANQLAERSTTGSGVGCKIACTRHSSATPTTWSSVSLTEKTQFPGFMFPR